MAEIIDIRPRLRRRAAEGSSLQGSGTVFRVRLCGPDLRWTGLVGGVLSEAFAREGYRTSFEELEETGGCPVLGMRAGRQSITETGSGQTPGLIVAATVISAAPLQGSDSRTVLLAQADAQGKKEEEFPGTAVLMLACDPPATPLEIAVASVAGAARLMGVIAWESLEGALREELTLASPGGLGAHLSMAKEAYDILADWEGVVAEMEEEI